MPRVEVTAQRVTLVGECNPHYARHFDPTLALYPLPSRGAGGRLQQILGLRTSTYLALGRVNLCDAEWSLAHAASRAAAVLAATDVVVLLGKRVAKAFAYTGEAFSVTTVSRRVLVSLPHPSGRCRVWNDPDSVPRARSLLSCVAPDVPWGETADVAKVTHSV